MRHFLSILLFFLVINLYTAHSKGYWHNITENIDRPVIAYKIAGDSNALYLGALSDGCKIYHSSNLGKTWNICYEENERVPFEYFRGFEYPAPGYMYLLFSNNNEVWGKGTGIKRLDERTGKIIDSIVIETRSGYTNLDDVASFEMIDSLNGILCSGALLSITRDGWKSFKQFDVYIGNYNEDSTEYIGYFQHVLYDIKLISKDTLMCKSFTLTDAISDVKKYGKYVFNISYFILEEGDTTFKYVPITNNGINLQISPDSICTINGNSDLEYKHPYDITYLNDSTWVYVSLGKKTGYGNCKTLEIFKTSNRGKYFYQVCNMDLQAFGLQRVKFKDEKNGLAVGNGAVLRTTDGGETWFADTAFYNNNWTKFPTSAGPLNVHISYADGMDFIGCFTVGVFKYETVFNPDDIEVNDISKRNHLVYPNPAQSGDMVKIDYPEYISGEILIHDIYGKHIDKVNFIGNAFRLKEGIPKGTYFIVISSNGEVLGREKFIVVE